MPIHDWSQLDAGIFHHFRFSWISRIIDHLNREVLPKDYYALAERHGDHFSPDILTRTADDADDFPIGLVRSKENGAHGLLSTEPTVWFRAETDLPLYRRKQNVVAVRHISGDELVAVVDIISKANKSARKPFDDFVRKAGEFLSRGVHLLILDLQPPTARDPQGIHGAIWDEVAGPDYARPDDKPLTLAAYRAGTTIRAFVEPVAVGDVPIDMPLYLTPTRYVLVPLDETYRTAFRSVPARWRRVLEPT